MLLIDPIEELGNVESLFVVESAVDVGHADDPVARLMHQRRRHRSDVAETLNGDARLIALQPEFCEGLVASDHQPAAGGFAAALRAAHLDRFAR